MLKSFFESLAEAMGFLAGFSFLSRLMKHMLLEHQVFSSYDELYQKQRQLIAQKREIVHLALQKAVASSPRKLSVNSKEIGNTSRMRESSQHQNSHRGAYSDHEGQPEQLQAEDFKFKVHDVNFYK